jgi:hypothetical protein
MAILQQWLGSHKRLELLVASLIMATHPYHGID